MIKHQKGTATLFVSVVALLIMTIVAFFVNRSTISDVLNALTMNQSSKSFEAAEAGLNFALAKINDETLVTIAGVQTQSFKQYFCTGNYVKDSTNGCNATLTNNSTNKYIFNENAPDSAYDFQVTMESPDPTKGLIITSIGGKDNCLFGINCNKKTIKTTFAIAPFLTKLPPDAISSPGSVTIGGSTCAENSTGNGGFAVRAGSSASTTNNLNGTGCTASGNGFHGAISTVDGSLQGMQGGLGAMPLSSSANDLQTYFQYVFGKSPNEMYAEADVKASDSLSNYSGCAKSCGKIIWLNNPGNNLAGTFGTLDDPVIVIINGSVDTSSNFTINGLLYVSGSLTTNGNQTVNGAISVAGAYNSQGSIDIKYDKSIFDAAKKIHAGYTMLGGAWRDWQ
ncbi:hypothetical protein NT239_09590 [Chitinibacter sp. SCUT-21]|uniref:pilus assembly PilX family protein n=1 Tax=Chitinibacter sp. SCUT-21 TaxID=2970891 RepID=UPI0035A61C58